MNTKRMSPITSGITIRLHASGGSVLRIIIGPAMLIEFARPYELRR